MNSSWLAVARAHLKFLRDQILKEMNGVLCNCIVIALCEKVTFDPLLCWNDMASGWSYRDE